jgi:hypothetical protein
MCDRSITYFVTIKKSRLVTGATFNSPALIKEEPDEGKIKKRVYQLCVCRTKLYHFWAKNSGIW